MHSNGRQGQSGDQPTALDSLSVEYDSSGYLSPRDVNAYKQQDYEVVN